MVNTMGTPQRPNRSVLIVEDEPRDTELITELLRECISEIAIDVAANAEEGLEKVMNSRYDLIICDYCLPGMDGLAFLKIVKKTMGNIPVLMLTGHPNQELEAQVIRHGSCTYLSKTAPPRIVSSVLTEALAHLPAWVM